MRLATPRQDIKDFADRDQHGIRVKYWVVAQRHTDLRDHFQQLAASARTDGAAFHSTSEDRKELKAERDRLRQHCDDLEQVVHTYATIINELSLENQALHTQLAQPASNVTPLRSRRGGPQ